MFNQYEKIFYREVLFEKVQKNKSDVLFIYSTANFQLKNPIKHKIEQGCVGQRLAETHNLKPCLYEENNDDYNFDGLFGLQLLRLVQMAGLGLVENLFVYDVNLISDNKYVVAFVLHFLERKKVNVYTKNGLLPKEHDNFKSVNGMRNFLRDYFLFQGLVTFKGAEFEEMRTQMQNEA